jgi:hypothetical protein
MKAALAFLLLVLAACSDSTPPPPPPTVSEWVVGPVVNGQNYSPGIVWINNGFDFTTAPPGVHGVTRAATEPGRNSIKIKFHIDGQANFVEVDAGGGTPGPGKLRLFIQRRGDDWGGSATGKASYRFYSQPVDLGTGSELQAMLVANAWTNVNGQYDADGFAALLADMATVGFAFGGMFAMHGVYATSPARFVLEEYILQ